MTEVEVRLPKQWKHWCRQAGLRPRRLKDERWVCDWTGKVHDERFAAPRDTRERWAWHYLHGRGREWRVNCFGMFQRGDTYAEFDRWALCEIAEAPIPKTRDEFVQTVEYLLRKDTP